MSVLGRVRFASAERLDLADIQSIDSYVSGDFKHLIKTFVGDSPFILRGFDVYRPAEAIGTEEVEIVISDAALYHPTSTAGSFFVGLTEGTYSLPLTPELRSNVTNYVYLVLSTRISRWIGPGLQDRRR